MDDDPQVFAARVSMAAETSDLHLPGGLTKPQRAARLLAGTAGVTSTGTLRVGAQLMHRVLTAAGGIEPWLDTCDAVLAEASS